MLILYFNKGYRTVNRYLAGFLFFSALYLLESFTFFYGDSLNLVAFFTISHGFVFYLIGPLSFFYVRGVLRDNTHFDKKDGLHFLLFLLSFTGSIPYFFTSWDYKLVVAQNMLSEQWNMSQFNLNIFIPHKIDQVLNVLLMYFYAGSLWYLIWKYKRKSNSRIYNVPQFKLMRNWLFVFSLIVTIITLNFSITVADILIYDDKSVFLEKASGPLLFASIVYVAINMVIMFFPHIMYGLPIGLKPKDLQTAKASETSISANDEPDFVLPEVQKSPADKNDLQLFTQEYMETIGASLESFIVSQVFLNTDFKLVTIVNEFGIPAHHLTYYFNDIKQVSFSEWRNSLRIKHAMELIEQGGSSTFTLKSIAQQSGFSSQNTFIRAFKNSTGTIPSNYLKSLS